MRYFLFLLTLMFAAPASAQAQSGSLYFCAAVDEGAGVYYHTDTYSADAGVSKADYDNGFLTFLKDNGMDGRGDCTFVESAQNVPAYLQSLTNDGAYGLRRVDWKYKVAQTASAGPLDNELKKSDACDMMDETNYREVGLSGGNDVQLKTMCAQAYEYWTMYKRALDQGYSLTDAKRTWDAHAAAARNAISFYENNRAD